MATIKTQGFKELDAALGEFRPATAKNILKRVGLAALEPVAEDMAARAPVDENGEQQLRKSIAASDKLNRRQKRLNRQPTTVEVYAGPAGNVGSSGSSNPPPSGPQQEFGNERHGPQPFARPAWDANQNQVLEDVKEGLGAEIEKAKERARRRALKAGR